MRVSEIFESVLPGAAGKPNPTAGAEPAGRPEPAFESVFSGSDSAAVPAQASPPAGRAEALRRPVPVAATAAIPADAASGGSAPGESAFVAPVVVPVATPLRPDAETAAILEETLAEAVALTRRAEAGAEAALGPVVGLALGLPPPALSEAPAEAGDVAASGRSAGPGAADTGLTAGTVHSPAPGPVAGQVLAVAQPPGRSRIEAPAAPPEAGSRRSGMPPHTAIGGEALPAPPGGAESAGSGREEAGQLQARLSEKAAQLDAPGRVARPDGSAAAGVPGRAGPRGIALADPGAGPSNAEPAGESSGVAPVRAAVAEGAAPVRSDGKPLPASAGAPMRPGGPGTRPEHGAGAAPAGQRTPAGTAERDGQAVDPAAPRDRGVPGVASWAGADSSRAVPNWATGATADGRATLAAKAGSDLTAQPPVPADRAAGAASGGAESATAAAEPGAVDPRVRPAMAGEPAGTLPSRDMVPAWPQLAVGPGPVLGGLPPAAPVASAPDPRGPQAGLAEVEAVEEQATPPEPGAGDAAGAAAQEEVPAGAAPEARAAAGDAELAGRGEAPEPLPAAAGPGSAGAAEAMRDAVAAPQESRDPRAETGIRAAVQAATALTESPDGRIELRLDPEELGPVRLGLAPGDGAITVQIVAERGETLDLLRRHADVLARELRQAGYGEVSFQFGADTASGGGSAPRHGYAPSSAPGAGEAPPAEPPRAAARQLPAPRGLAPGALDLRL